MDKITCELPTLDEMSQIIDMHLPFIDPENKRILLEYMDRTDVVLSKFA